MRELTEAETARVAGGAQPALDYSLPAMGLGGLPFDWAGMPGGIEFLDLPGPIMGPVLIGPTIAPVSGVGEERRGGS